MHGNHLPDGYFGLRYREATVRAQGQLLPCGLNIDNNNMEEREVNVSKLAPIPSSGLSIHHLQIVAFGPKFGCRLRRINAGASASTEDDQSP